MTQRVRRATYENTMRVGVQGMSRMLRNMEDDTCTAVLSQQ